MLLYKTIISNRHSIEINSVENILFIAYYSIELRIWDLAELFELRKVTLRAVKSILHSIKVWRNSYDFFALNAFSTLCKKPRNTG